MLSDEIRSLFAVISLGLVIIGFFWAMIYFAPPAIVFAILALYTAPGEKVITTTYRVCAFIGLAAGVLETVAAILILTGIVTLPY